LPFLSSSFVPSILISQGPVPVGPWRMIPIHPLSEHHGRYLVPKGDPRSLGARLSLGFWRRGVAWPSLSSAERKERKERRQRKRGDDDRRGSWHSQPCAIRCSFVANNTSVEVSYFACVCVLLEERFSRGSGQHGYPEDGPPPVEIQQQTA
jgi:hypothetical protein